MLRLWFLRYRIKWFIIGKLHRCRHVLYWKIYDRLKRCYTLTGTKFNYTFKLSYYGKNYKGDHSRQFTGKYPEPSRLPRDIW